MSKLDKKEKEILNAFDAGKLRKSKGSGKEIECHKEYAQATFKKDTRINIHLSSRDLRALQARALQEGIPYQTLVASVLHKYVAGKLVEKRT